MEYKEAIDFLFAQLPMFSRVGAAAYKPGLERSLALADFFANPQRRLRAIHVAGTNGKGSTSHMLAAILQSQGYKVALYTSPHLVDFRERIRIDGKMIPEKKVVEFVEKWQRSGYTGDRPSFFELTMMMAFDWFAAEEVDYAVIEVGMGGRLDSTNILTPLLSVVTNISWDHMQFLGDTLPRIAYEKAGIIKAGIPAVIGEAEGEVEQVFRNRAREVGAPLREAYREIESMEADAPECCLKGSYQKWNINTVRVAVDELRRLGLEISREAEANGFLHADTLTGLQGRWMKTGDNPLVICDTGHNEAGLRYNMAQIAGTMAGRPGGRVRFVIGFVADKDVDHILDLFPAGADYYITQAQIPRAMPWRDLLDRCRARGLRAEGFPTVAEAVATALADSSPADMLYIGGSTFIVADYLRDITQ